MHHFQRKRIRKNKDLGDECGVSTSYNRMFDLMERYTQLSYRSRSPTEVFPTSTYQVGEWLVCTQLSRSSDHDRYVHTSAPRWVSLGMTKREIVSFGVGGVLSFRDVICFRFS